MWPPDLLPSRSAPRSRRGSFRSSGWRRGPGDGDRDRGARRAAGRRVAARGAERDRRTALIGADGGGAARRWRRRSPPARRRRWSTSAADARPRAAAALRRRAPRPALDPLRAPTQALKAADLVVAAGGFGMVALDLGDARPRIPDAAWMRLQHAARDAGDDGAGRRARRARLGAFAAAAVELGAGAPRFVTDGPPLFAGWTRGPCAPRAAPAPVRRESRRERCHASSLAFTSRS